MNNILNLDLTNVEEAGNFQKVVPGGYICQITSVENVSDKQYLKIEFDIIEGDLKGYYQALFKSKMFWGGRFIRSYKETALPFFKSFITSLENSNASYKWDGNIDKLKGLKTGLILGEEEYVGNNGEVKIRTYVAETRSCNVIKNNDFVIPKPKLLAPIATTNFVEITADDDMPF